MSLMDLLQSQDPATRNGLLNFGLSLLQSKGNFGNAVGQAGVAAQLGARDFRRQQELLNRTALQDRLIRQQIAEGEQRAKMRNLPQQFYRAPSAPGVDATGGMETAMDNPANAASPGGFDMPGYLQALAGIDPVMALQLSASMREKAPQPIKLGEGDQLIDPTTYKPIASNPKAAKPEALPSAVQEYNFAVGQGYKGSFDEWKKSNARAGASTVTANSYGAPVQGIGPDGKPAFFQANKAGQASIVPGVTPPPSATQEKTEAEKQKSGLKSEQLLSTISSARKLLKSGPTASGVGAATDAAGRFVGVTTQGAAAAAQLETLAGWMVANVPRMEGPQSNFDVENYRTMAAKVGDRTVPVKERLAALDTLEALQRKYADINGTPVSGGGSGVVDWGSLK